MQDKNIFVFDTVENDVLAGRKAPKPCTKIMLATAPCIRMPGKEQEPLRNKVNETIRGIYASTFLRNVKPNFGEF